MDNNKQLQEKTKAETPVKRPLESIDNALKSAEVSSNEPTAPSEPKSDETKVLGASNDSPNDVVTE